MDIKFVGTFTHLITMRLAGKGPYFFKNIFCEIRHASPQEKIVRISDSDQAILKHGNVVFHAQFSLRTSQESKLPVESIAMCSL
jgi:hypothetical protein